MPQQGLLRMACLVMASPEVICNRALAWSHGRGLHSLGLMVVACMVVVCIGVAMGFLIDGQITSFCPNQHGGEAFNTNNAAQTHSIFVKL